MQFLAQGMSFPEVAITIAALDEASPEIFNRRV
jgi:hypothetical protein